LFFQQLDILLDPLTIIHARCSCAKGLGEGCGHVAALLYQIADYKARGVSVVPSETAKTSKQQTFHQPRGTTIRGEMVQDLTLKGYGKKTPLSQTDSKGIQSTLYNPVRGEMPNLQDLADALDEAAPQFLVLPALRATVTETRTKFGQFPVGSAVAVQQRLHADFQINVYDSVPFPSLPLRDMMVNNYAHVLHQHQSLMLEDIKVTPAQSNSVEEKTRLQSCNTLWHDARKHRITASKAHLIFRRQRNFDTLVQQLKKKSVQTRAMREGLEDEPVAAHCYGQVIRLQGNVLPCGLVISPFASWIAASPDRKVYLPNKAQPFGILEIKCPRKDSVSECPYLKPIPNGLLLNRKHEYYTQVQTQLAVTGLPWCDFFVWTKQDHHRETINFDPVFWQDVKDAIDYFYFNYFTMV
jgi:hypothetical protein